MALVNVMVADEDLELPGSGEEFCGYIKGFLGNVHGSLWRTESLCQQLL